MDEQTNSQKSIKRLIPAVVAGIIILLFVKMHTMPPEGQWVKDSSSPVLPSLRYSHINEPWAKAYLHDKPPTTTEAIQPPPGLPADNGGRHSYFSSPRFISARNNSAQVTYRDPNASSAATPALTNESPVHTEDLLRPGYMKDNQNIYQAEFGTAGDATKH